MAETFLAVQRGAAGFEQRVCVKFILPTLRDDAGFNALFLREATIAASLRHSNIVGVIDVDQERGYIVLELVDGVDLRGLLNAAPNHRLPAHLVTLIALELAKALAYAHGRTRQGEAAGIVHRDISPSNVLVSYSGEIKLADFGIAKAIHSEVEPQSHTVKGKLCYMSPEQTRNEPLDGRSDLFSLGIVCYELLAGRRPFDGQHDNETILRLNQGEHTPLAEAAPDVPGGLALVVERAISVDKEARFQTADAFIDALSRFASPATAYRELGEFARQARPHETLSTQDIEPVGSEERALKVGRDSKRPPSGAPRPALVAAAQDARSSGVTRVLGAPRASGLRSVSRRAWGVLGLSVALFTGVAAAWVGRTAGAGGEGAVVSQRALAARAPSASQRARSSTPPISADTFAKLVNAGRVAAAGESKPASAVAAGEASAPPSSPPPATVPEPVPPQPMAAKVERTTPTPTQRAASSERGQATLRVGTIPLGQVWIDGKVAGWSPVVVQVAPGRHSVAGGSDTPQVSKELRLRAGERRQLVLNLEDVAAARNSAAANSGATSVASGR